MELIRLLADSFWAVFIFINECIINVSVLSSNHISRLQVPILFGVNKTYQTYYIKKAWSDMHWILLTKLSLQYKI